jgi:hypothetical protein
MKFEGVRSVSFPAVSPWPLRVMLQQVRSMLQLGEDYVRRLDEDEVGGDNTALQAMLSRRRAACRGSLCEGAQARGQA